MSMNDVNLQPILYMLITSSLKDTNNVYYISFLLLLLPILINFINFITTAFNELYTNYINKKNYVSIKFPVHKIKIIKDHWKYTISEKNIYSPAFKAINWYLKHNIKNISGIQFLTEIIDNDNHICSDKDFFLIPEQTNMIELSKINNIYAKIITNYIDNSDPDDNNDKNNKSTTNKKCKNYELELIKLCNTSSLIEKSTNIDILISWLDKCILDYNNSIKIIDDKLYIFEYINSYKDEYSHVELNFKKYVMNHNKDFTKNLFFEDKHKMLDYINKFKYYPDNINPAEMDYAKSGCAYKSCMLFDGEPGTGKTTTIKAIARQTNRHIVILNMNRIKTCEEFESIIRNTSFNKHEVSGKQLLFVIEDADATNNSVFLSRDFKKEQEKDTEDIKLDKPIKEIINNINNGKQMMENLLKQNDQLDLSTILNTMDGVIELDGVMLIISTNYKNKFDKALLRPGRIDYQYTFKNATNNIIREMIKYRFDVDNDLLSKYPLIDNITDFVLSPAEVQSISFKNNDVESCINELYQLFQQKNKK